MNSQDRIRLCRVVSVLLIIDDELDDAEGRFLESFVDQLGLSEEERAAVARELSSGVDVLRDVERVVDWIVCLNGGRLVVDAALDDLRERYNEWRVTSRNGGLPARFSEAYVLRQEGDGRQAKLIVLDAADERAAFEARYHAEIEAVPLNLEGMFPLLGSPTAGSEGEVPR